MSVVLSIVVPSYNVEKYLNKCLTSFADERLNDRLQVMIVNDGSTDSTEEIAELYTKRFPRIFELINKQNGGHGSAVNAGIDHAKGKYFRIVDGDDWVNTENLIKLIDILDVTNTCLVVDEKREVNMSTKKTQKFPLPTCVEKNEDLEFKNICSENDICTYIMLHTLSIKTDLLKRHQIRLLEHVFYVDIEFIIKSTINAKTIKFVDLEIYQYLVGNEAQSVNYNNYVKRYNHHDKVTRELICFATDFCGDELIERYLDRRIVLLINTHLNISLIYNENRREGLQQTIEFEKFLLTTNMKYFKLNIKRLILTTLLHFLGVNFLKIEHMKKYLLLIRREKG